jgi:hypothetical protein
MLVRWGQQVSGTSVQEIEKLIAELHMLRETLQNEAARVQREIMGYLNGEYGCQSPMHWWGSGMNTLQNWPIEAKTLPGPSPITFERRSNVAAIGTDSNRARRCKPRQFTPTSGQRGRSLRGCGAFVRERAHYSS